MDEIVESPAPGGFVHQPMQSYSSGMDSRLRFAISSAAAEDILRSTKPWPRRRRVPRPKQCRIDSISEHAGTVFLSSHSLKENQQMCTQVLWIEQGELKMDGPTEEVCAAYQESITPKPAQKKARKAAAKKAPAEKA